MDPYGLDTEVSEVLVEEGASEQPEQEIEEQEELSFDFDDPQAEVADEADDEASGDELNPDSPNFDPNKAFKRMHAEFTRKSQELAELKRQVPESEELKEIREKAQRFDALATPQGRRALRSLISGDEEQQEQHLAFMSIPNDPLADIDPRQHVTEDSLPVFQKIVVDTVSQRLTPYVQKMETGLAKMTQIEQFLVQLAQSQQKNQASDLAKQFGDTLDDKLASKISELTRVGLSPQQAYYALRGEELVAKGKQRKAEGKKAAMLVSPQIASTSKKVNRAPKDLADFIEEAATEAGYRPRI